MVDYSAGHISQEDAGRLIEALKSELEDEETRFYQGKSYRNLMLLKGDFTELECTPPHDIMGEALTAHVPGGKGARRVIGLMEKSRQVLDGAASGRAPADMIWPWGQGTRMNLEPFEMRFGLSGCVISAVDLICGLGLLAGLRPTCM